MGGSETWESRRGRSEISAGIVQRYGTALVVWQGILNAGKLLLRQYQYIFKYLFILLSVILKESKAEPHQFAERKQTNTKSHAETNEEKKRKKDTMEKEEEEEGEDREIEETRSSPAKHRGTREVSARGGAWARFEPRLKTDKDIDGVGGAGVVQGGGLLQSPLGSYPTRSRYASGSGSSNEREC